MELCQYSSQNRIRSFTIEAIELPIVYNQYGDHDPNGLLYVLAEDADRIIKKARQNFEMDPPKPYEEVVPLVLRVNLGDTVKICFRNRLNRRLSIHVQGLENLRPAGRWNRNTARWNTNTTTETFKRPDTTM